MRDCEICGKAKKRLVFNQRFIIPSKNFFHSGYDVSICEKCGFAFADNIPNQAFLDKYYQAMKKKTFYRKKGVSNEQKDKDERMLIKQHTFSANIISKYLNKQSSILDVGCDTGSLLEILKKRGFNNVLGLDMSSYSAKIAKEKRGINVKVGSIFDDLKLGKFDFIILTHVLEHIKDLNIFITKLQSYLNDNGKIYIEVPDAHNFFIAKDNDSRYLFDQKEPFMQFSVEHINYFSKISLNSLVKKNGLSKIFLKTLVSTISIIASVWEKTTPEKDVLIEKKLKNYVKESNRKLNKPLLIINEIAKSKTEIYVWGAGLHTQRLLSSTKLIDAKINSFIDSDPSYQGEKLINKQIISPKKLLNKPNFPILISTRRYQQEILLLIKRLGLKNRVIILYK